MTTNFLVAGRRRLVAQPGGLLLGFALHLIYIHILTYFKATSHVIVLYVSTAAEQ